MREDERRPLSKAMIQKSILKDTKMLTIVALFPLLTLALMAIIFTAVTVNLWPTTPWPFKIMFVAFVLPLWGGVAYFLYQTLGPTVRLRKALKKDLLRIETDEVSYLTEEAELHRSGRMAYPDKAYVVYLEKHGRCVIDRTLWHILKAGDEVYVAVIHHPNPKVCRVYSPLTHRIVEH